MEKKHYLIFLFLLGIDQASKFYIDSTFKLNEHLSIIPNFFQITYTRNEGAAWSILEGKMLFFYIVSIVAIILLGYFYKHTKKHEYMSRLGIVFMLSGTIGNFIDRLQFQYVRDFLDFQIFGYDFPIFNVADMALCIGVFFVILDVVMEYYGVKKYERI